MKWKRIFGWSAAGVLGAVVLAAAGGYCWLYSWSWGGMPTAHSSFSPEEALRLQRLDAYLTDQGRQDFIAAAKQWVDLSLQAADDWEEDSSDNLDWWDQQVLKYGIDYALRTAFAPARSDLHRLVESGRADDAVQYLAVAALHARDCRLVKLIVSRGLDVNRVQIIGDSKVVFAAEVINGGNLSRSEYMPVAERLELLEWLVERGMDIKGADMLLPQLELAVMQTGDEQGRITEWMLRRGFLADKTKVTSLLLRYPTTLSTLQRLIQDGLLPVVPQEFVTEERAYTPLAMVVANITPSPETVRWLISEGYDVNGLPTTLIQHNDEEESSYDAEPLTPLDSCLRTMTYEIPDTGEEERLNGRFQILDLLLEHGARPTSRTEELLPIDADLKQRVLELLQRHGYHITAGEMPDNPCCIP